MKRMAHSNVLIVGLKGLGCEIGISTSRQYKARVSVDRILYS